MDIALVIARTSSLIKIGEKSAICSPTSYEKEKNLVLTFNRVIFSSAPNDYIICSTTILSGFHTCVGSGGERHTPDWYKEQGIEMLYEDPVTGVDIEKQTLTTSSGKLLKYGTLIIATGCTASRWEEIYLVHYIRDVVDADSLISSLGKAKKLVVVVGGYIGMEVAAAAVAWKLDTTIIPIGASFVKIVHFFSCPKV